MPCISPRWSTWHAYTQARANVFGSQEALEYQIDSDSRWRTRCDTADTRNSMSLGSLRRPEVHGKTAFALSSLTRSRLSVDPKGSCGVSGPAMSEGWLSLSTKLEADETSCFGSFFAFLHVSNRRVTRGKKRVLLQHGHMDSAKATRLPSQAAVVLWALEISDLLAVIGTYKAAGSLPAHVCFQSVHQQQAQASSLN